LTEQRINTIKAMLRISYLLLMIVSLLASIYFIFAFAYARAYGGGDISWIELIWNSIGTVVTLIFSGIAFFGLKKPNKLGVFFSYSLPTGMGIYFLIANINSTLYELEQEVKMDFKYIIELIIGTILIIGIPWLLILGTRKVEIANFQFKKIDYGITCGLILTLILSWYIMFKF